MGRSTKWDYDIQGRTRQKTYPDGTATSFLYEPRTSRLRERMDAKGQKTLFEYNTDDTQRRISYPNALVPTPSVAFTYDPDYDRPVQMTDGIGTNQYSYNPVSGIPRLGAGKLARVDGPLPNASIAYQYDELGAVRSYAVSGDVRSAERDLAGRILSETNALVSSRTPTTGAPDAWRRKPIPTAKPSPTGTALPSKTSISGASRIRSTAPRSPNSPTTAMLRPSASRAGPRARMGSPPRRTRSGTTM